MNTIAAATTMQIIQNNGRWRTYKREFLKPADVSPLARRTVVYHSVIHAGIY